jgi:hypothetical protein
MRLPALIRRIHEAVVADADRVSRLNEEREYDEVGANTVLGVFVATLAVLATVIWFASVGARSVSPLERSSPARSPLPALERSPEPRTPPSPGRPRLS